MNEGRRGKKKSRGDLERGSGFWKWKNFPLLEIQTQNLNCSISAFSYSSNISGPCWHDFPHTFYFFFLLLLLLLLFLLLRWRQQTREPRRHDIITRVRWKHVTGVLGPLVFRLSSALSVQCFRCRSSVGGETTSNCSSDFPCFFISKKKKKKCQNSSLPPPPALLSAL